MQTNNLKNNLAKELSAIMPINEAHSEIDFIIKEHLNIDKTKLILNPKLLEAHKEEINKIIKTRLTTRKPLQYILNKATFFDDIYYVDENVLIPRPETEILVNESAKYLNANSKILEIGTGSGCIAISLAKSLKNKNITACDISKEALNIARKNAEKISQEYKINFIHSDLFNNINEKFDAIISNPPYIDEKLKKEMQPEVLNYEPHNALFAENEGMFIYEQIIKNAHNYLNDAGFLAFEIGINQSEKIETLLKNSGFEKVIIITDLSSIDRTVLAWYN